MFSLSCWWPHFHYNINICICHLLACKHILIMFKCFSGLLLWQLKTFYHIKKPGITLTNERVFINLQSFHNNLNKIKKIRVFSFFTHPEYLCCLYPWDRSRSVVLIMSFHSFFFHLHFAPHFPLPLHPQVSGTIDLHPSPNHLGNISLAAAFSPHDS